MTSLEQSRDRQGAVPVFLSRWFSPSSPSRPFLPPVWATTLVIVAIGVFSIYLMQDTRQPTGPSSHTANSPATILPSESEIRIVTGQNLLNWTTKLDQPLESEMRSVVADAKAAIQLLAQNFLPENTLEPGTKH